MIAYLNCNRDDHVWLNNHWCFCSDFANQNSTLFQPGIAASIVYRNQVIYSKGFGLINKTKPDVPDGNTIFRIGSVSKVFVVS